jgi:hypothetical protein
VNVLTTSYSGSLAPPVTGEHALKPAGHRGGWLPQWRRPYRRCMGTEVRVARPSELFTPLLPLPALCIISVTDPAALTGDAAGFKQRVAPSCVAVAAEALPRMFFIHTCVGHKLRDGGAKQGAGRRLRRDLRSCGLNLRGSCRQIKLRPGSQRPGSASDGVPRCREHRFTAARSLQSGLHGSRIQHDIESGHWIMPRHQENIAVYRAGVNAVMVQHQPTTTGANS